MHHNGQHRQFFLIFTVAALLIMSTGLLVSLPVASVQGANLGEETASEILLANSLALDPPPAPEAACSGGPVIDGITLDECVVENFTVGGTGKSITVWYTNNPVTATRIVDGSPVVLSHWIDNDAQAQQVADWGREAWVAYFDIFGKHPYDTGCGNNINVQMEDGVGWAGIAYWASSGSCWIGIDSPMVRGGGGQWAVYHEFQHYLQYAYNDGCYAYLKPNYPDDAEYVEGYADLASDAVDSALDAIGYGNAVAGYNPTTSFFDKDYGDVYNKYYIEQVGSQWTPADPEHHMDALREHYEECDLQNTLYVLDSLIPALRPGLTEKALFLNFFAANWAKDWADPVTQPELVYTDDDGNPYGQIALAQDVSLSSGSASWTGEATPDDWAGKYYQVRPQAGCEFVTVNVDGAAGSLLGINLMAADTVAPTSVNRVGWIGENFSRTFPGYGVYNRIAASVNAFSSVGSYDVSFTCVTPALDILEPRQVNFALVGDPASPIAFLSRFKVTSSGAPVLGLPEASFGADAEGDAISFVAGSLHQVGEEYWAIMLPPIKPAGTTFVDLQVCLEGTICDTETDALLYVDPGHTDTALVFDASGSMAFEDIAGEGTRLENAKKAGTVLADLLRVDDRILVTDFSATDNPPGCGLPGGTGNCPLDIRTLLARTDVAGPGTIAAAKAAIDSISAREWTPIGAALVDAKNQLQAAPYSLNPKQIVLLSDGEENVNPLYAAVRADLIASGVVIDTVGFSGDAPPTLLAQIAADTGGTYRYVPTTPGSLNSTAESRLQELLDMGVPPELANRLNTAVLPGPLGLDDVYDYYETKGQAATRLFHYNSTGRPLQEWQYASQYVDGSVNVLRLVVASKQPDYLGCSGFTRFVEVLRPDDPQQRWVPVSPPTGATPADWDVRNSLYDDVVIIPNPAPGVWQIRSANNYCIPAEGTGSAPESVNPEQLVFDVMMNASAQSDVRLHGRFLPPIVNNQGVAGDTVPIVATLLQRTGAISGVLVIGAVEKPGSIDYLLLLDDGAHSDGAAGDGIYGGTYGKTNVGGTYNVRLVAGWWDPVAGQWRTREWLGGFWIQGPELNDGDGDGLPDDWERRCKLGIGRDDAQEDPDRDGLTNIRELELGTVPCDSDTDNGGERDGSEVLGQRNPLYAPDDVVRPLGHISLRPLNQIVLIRWPRPSDYLTVKVYVSTDPEQLGNPTDMGDTGVYTLTGLINDQVYYLTLAGETADGQGEYTDPLPVTPKADPDPPSGAILINNGALSTRSRDVTLDLSSTDTPLPGMAQSANAHLGGPLALRYNTISGNVEMRISNDPSFAGAAWEPLAWQKPWTLGGAEAGIYRVYAQFRDGAGNESWTAFDDILLLPAYTIYLPYVSRAP